ncbi:MAG: NUDIX hydrolase [Bacilli bacterium]|nr:NUDIX hydrolase [Bacilli bacterium]
MKDKIDFYYIEKGEYAPRDGIPFVKRENVAVVIRYQKEYLFLSWNGVNYQNSLVTGGIEANEDREEAVKRETIEETGYYDFKSITKIDCVNVSKFFVEHKNQNREAIYYPYLVELNSLAKKDITNDEQKEHSSIWVTENELDKLSLFENHRMMLNKSLKK